MPEMNMIFQCCFVISESSIRERMSVSLSGVCGMGDRSLGAFPRVQIFEPKDEALMSVQLRKTPTKLPRHC
jgi:hypothetical protein